MDRYRPDIYDYDDEEEKWFNDEEESIAPLEDNIHSLSTSLLSTTPPASLPGAPSLVPSFFNNPSEPTDAAFLHPTSHAATFPSFVGSPRPPIKIKPITIGQKLSTSPVSVLCTINLETMCEMFFFNGFVCPNRMLFLSFRHYRV